MVRRGIDLASLDGSQSARFHADIVQGRPAISQTDHQPPGPYQGALRQGPSMKEPQLSG